MREMLLMISLLGFLLLFRWARKDLHPAFFPALTVSFLSLINFLGGLLGVLAWTAKGLLMLGVCLFPVMGFLLLRPILRKTASGGAAIKETGEKGPNANAFLWMLGSFCVLCAGAMLLLRGRFLYGYDDFSHWGLAAKIMITESRFPVSADDLMFPSYPPGAACFLCYCSAALGGQDDALLTGQAVMLISFLLSLQCASGRQNRGYLLTTLLVPVFLFYNSQLDMLAVDNLLGACFLSALLFAFQEEAVLKKHVPFLALLLACCLLLKNSGLFLALAPALWAVRAFLPDRKKRIENREKKKRFPSEALWLLLPLAVYLAWRLHLKMNFTSYGKYFMSLKVYFTSFQGKQGELGTILGVILPVMINPLKNHGLWLIPAYLAAWLAFPPEKRKDQKRVFRFCGILFVLYEIGILVMYVCSMGTEELLGQRGGDFVRYNGTIVCALAGSLVFLLGKALQSVSLYEAAGTRPAARGRRGSRETAFAAAALLLTGVSLSLNMTRLLPLSQVQAEFADAYAFFLVSESPDLPEDQDVVVLFREPEISEYLAFMANFRLHSSGTVLLCGANDAETARSQAEGAVLIDLQEGVIR